MTFLACSDPVAPPLENIDGLKHNAVPEARFVVLDDSRPARTVRMNAFEKNRSGHLRQIPPARFEKRFEARVQIVL